MVLAGREEIIVGALVMVSGGIVMSVTEYVEGVDVLLGVGVLEDPGVTEGELD